MRAYRHQTVLCDECGGDGEIVYPVRWSGEAYGEYAADLCHVCNGNREIDAECRECGDAGALDDTLLCERCHDGATLPIAEFAAKYQLTETHGDPMKWRAA